MSRTILLQDLTSVAAQLGHGELEVLLLLARRVREGQARYGRLDVYRDRRKFKREALEELVDGLFYLSAGLLRHQDHAADRRRAGGRRP
jgi:hypothetical protein